MPKFYPAYLYSILFMLCSTASAQTVLAPGDIAVLGVVTDLGVCVKPESDEISFVCFKDITPFTTIILTDNGWEAVNNGYWGDSEATLKFTRTGGVIPRAQLSRFVQC